MVLLDHSQQHPRQYGNAGHLHRFRLPRPGRRVRHPDESHSLRREQLLWPDFRRRSAQYGPGRLPGDHFGDRSRIHHRCRAAVQQLGDRQIGDGLCRSHPQHSPAVADFLLVHRGASGAARHPPEHHVWRLVLSQQPGLLLSKTRFRRRVRPRLDRIDCRHRRDRLPEKMGQADGSIKRVGSSRSFMPRPA